jgi:hypothetical protein
MLNERESSPTLTNCAFTGNTAYAGGGMANAYNSNPTLTNCTLAGNTAIEFSGGFGGLGGAMLNNFSSSPTVINCILWGNTAMSGGDGIYNYDSASNPLLSHTDDQDLANAAPDANGNFAADPLFVRNPSPGADGNWGTADDDYGDLHLRTGSPCINAGDNTVVTSPPFPADSSGVPLDLDGKTRVVGSAVDLGAYEYVPLPTYAWSGFLSPLHKQSFKEGNTIPVKFALTGASAGITNLSASLYVTAPGGTTETLLGAFKYDPTSGQYQFNWKTKGWPAGAYTLRADLGDGVQTRTVSIMLN